ncbi:hypothetical protein GCM10029964_025550 [Kibdelosporangium lantanae]
MAVRRFAELNGLTPPRFAGSATAADTSRPDVIDASVALPRPATRRPVWLFAKIAEIALTRGFVPTDEVWAVTRWLTSAGPAGSVGVTEGALFGASTALVPVAVVVTDEADEWADEVSLTRLVVCTASRIVVLFVTTANVPADCVGVDTPFVVAAEAVAPVRMVKLATANVASRTRSRVRIGLLLVEDQGRGGWGRVRESYDMCPPWVKNVTGVHACEQSALITAPSFL